MFLFRYLDQTFWEGQVDLQGGLLFQLAVMWWPLIVLSLHEHVQLMQALGHSAEPQVPREAHLSILQNKSAHPQAGIHLM
jgi:hypothetical protein